MNRFRLVWLLHPLIGSRLLCGGLGLSRFRGAISEVKGHNALGEPVIECGENGFADGRAMFEDVRVPEAQDGIALATDKLVADFVSWAVSMLAAVDFNDKPPFAAGEVDEIGANRQLAREAIAAEFSILQLKPKKSFGLVATLTKSAGASCRAGPATAARFLDSFPHSVAASRRHLYPLRRERKGARFGELAPFLSPVDRGRGGRRSRPEWGSTTLCHPQKSVGAPPSALRFSTKASSSSRMAGSIAGSS